MFHEIQTVKAYKFYMLIRRVCCVVELYLQVLNSVCPSLSVFLSVMVELFAGTVLYIHFRSIWVYYISRNIISMFIEAVFSSSPGTIRSR
jgi:hypothetical protein